MLQVRGRLVVLEIMYFVKVERLVEIQRELGLDAGRVTVLAENPNI